MFANWPGAPFYATVRLGYVNILADVMQGIPTRTALVGVGPYSDAQAGENPSGASIEVSSVFPANTAVVELGSTSPDSYSSDIENISIVCVPPSGLNPIGSIGLYVPYGQEMTRGHQINIRGCYTGLLITNRAGDGVSLDHLNITDTGLPGGNTSFVCIQMGDSSLVQDQFMADISEVACGSTATTPANFILADGTQYTIRHVRFEANGAAATNGINVGSQTISGVSAASNIVLEDIQCAGSAGISGNCVLLNTHATGPIAVIAVNGGNSGANILQDTIAGGCTIPKAATSNVGFYARSGQSIDALATTSVACHGGAIATAHPTVSSCGTGAAVSSANDFGGYINPGSGGVTSCVLTFAQHFANPPQCVGNAATSSNVPVPAWVSARSTTAITLTTAADVSSGSIQFQCNTY